MDADKNKLDEFYMSLPRSLAVPAALIVGALSALVCYGFFAEFEHRDWFPRELAAFLNRYEFRFFGGLGWLVFLLARLHFRARFGAKERGVDASSEEQRRTPAPHRAPAAHQSAAEADRPDQSRPSSDDPFARNLNDT